MALAITSFTPSGGPTTGGTKVAIVGTELDTVDAVMFGAHEGTIDTSATNTAISLTVLAPPIANDGTLVVKLVVLDNDLGREAQSSGSYTYTVVSSPVLTSQPARKWKLQVDTSVAQDGSSYVDCRGLRDLQPSVTATMQDDSDYDSNGWGSELKTMLKWALVGKFARKYASGYVEDPGQKTIRTAQDKFGSAGVVRVRWFDRNGGTSEAYEGYAQVQWSDDGGTPDALSLVSFTLSGQGARTAITNPA